MIRRSVPPSSRWVAKLCRRVWTVTCLPRPAASRAPASLSHRARGDRSIRQFTREEELGRAVRLPVRAEDREQSGREHRVAVLPTLGLAEANDHPPAVDVVDAQGHDLGDAEPGGVSGHEDGTVLEAGDRLEELSDLAGAQDDGELPLRLGGDNVIHDPFLAQGATVEEPQGGNGLAVIALGGGLLLLLDKEEKIGPDVGCPQALG